jgi:CRP-like cAMP-binding protein
MQDTIFYLDKGEILITENDEKFDLYWLLKGELDVIKTINGIEQKIASINSGELVGEIAFIDRQKRTATVRARNRCQLAVLDRNHFEAMMDEQPKWIKKLIETLASRIRNDGKVEFAKLELDWDPHL